MRRASFLAIALLGFGLRTTHLGARPMHTDEAVNAYIVGQTLAGKPFLYDPADRHGPALAAFALPLARAQGAHSFAQLTESELRLTSVLAGTVTLLLFGAASELFGFAPCLLAAALTAIAPLPVYYDRYFIHESLLAAATFALILTAWRAWSKPDLLQAALAGLSAAVMLACKETALLHFAALAAAALICSLWKARDRAPISTKQRRVLASAGVTFLLVTLAFYTWLGRDWTALSTLPHALPAAMARASGEGHQKPVWYYALLLSGGWSGGILCVLASVGCFIAIRRRSESPYRLLALYALLLAALYSFIPYKTPWLALDIWVPFALLASLATQMLYRNTSRRRSAASRLATIAACLIALAAIGDTWQRVFVHPVDEANPYAYAHTSEDLLDMPSALNRLAREQGIASPRIAVIAADPWPLPWYLRTYSQTGYWQPGQQVGPADFYITSTEAAPQYETQLHNLRPEFFGLRPGVLILVWSREHE